MDRAEIGISGPTQGKWPVHMGIGRTQLAVTGCLLAPFVYRFSPFAYHFSPYWDHFDNGNAVVEAVPIRTETVRKRTKAVGKRCMYSVRLQQAEYVLCPCVWSIFPVQSTACSIEMYYLAYVEYYGSYHFRLGPSHSTNQIPSMTSHEAHPNKPQPEDE